MFLFIIIEISRVTLEILSIRRIYCRVVGSAEQFRERIEFDMNRERVKERKREKKALTHTIFVTYTLVRMNGNVRGKCMACSISRILGTQQEG